jgi:hypothetical protein
MFKQTATRKKIADFVAWKRLSVSCIHAPEELIWRLGVAEGAGGIAQGAAGVDGEGRDEESQSFRRKS